MRGVKQGKADYCDIRTYVPAEAIEQEVWEAVRRLMDDKEYVLTAPFIVAAPEHGSRS
jgi:hypothetical protein